MERFSDIPEESREQLLIRHNKSLMERVEYLSAQNQDLARKNDSLRTRIAFINSDGHKALTNRVNELSEKVRQMKLSQQEGGKRKSKIMLSFILSKGLIDEYRIFRGDAIKS